MASKILLLRFSSFGDVTECLSVASRLAELGEVHWATRKDLAPLLENHPSIKKIWDLERREGAIGLFRLIANLRRQKFTHIYDAHNSLRSRLICLTLSPLLNPRSLLTWPKVIRKPSFRWKRFLLFRFHINRFQMPFSGQRDLLQPLAKWKLSTALPAAPQLFVGSRESVVVDGELWKIALQNFVVLCPSAAYPLKRWPIDYWKKLIALCPKEHFVLLGGVHDAFVGDLVAVDPNRVHNFAGRLSLLESAVMIARARMTVSNDTGLLHVAEQLGKPCIALMGPAPFGFPSRPATKILEVQLSCRPCSKHGQGPCRNEKYQRCLVDIKPEQVADLLQLSNGKTH